MSEVFLFAKKAAFTDLDVTDLLVGRICSPNVVIIASRAIGHQALLIHLRRHSLDHGNLCPQEIQIFAGEANLSASLAAAGLQRSSSRENRHQVAAERLECDHQRVLKSRPISQQKYDRGNSPGPAQ